MVNSIINGIIGPVRLPLDIVTYFGGKDIILPAMGYILPDPLLGKPIGTCCIDQVDPEIQDLVQEPFDIFFILVFASDMARAKPYNGYKNAAFTEFACNHIMNILKQN